VSHADCRAALVGDRVTTRVEAHLDDCLECAAFARSLETVLVSASRLAPPAPPDGMVERLFEELAERRASDRSRNRRPWEGLGSWLRANLRPLALASTVAVVLGLLGGAITRYFPREQGRATSPVVVGSQRTPSVTQTPLPALLHGIHLSRPGGVALGVTGLFAKDYVYVADTGDHRLVETDPAHEAYVILDASNLALTPQAVTVGSHGVLYLAGVNPSGGFVTSVSLNGGSLSSFSVLPEYPANKSPQGVAVDGAGRVYVASVAGRTGSSAPDVVRITPGQGVTVVAGGGGSTADGVPATSARLSNPAGIAFDAAGNLFIADRTDGRIRKVALDGTISTVAGNGMVGFAGDGGPATAAALAHPSGIAIDSAGNLYIADTGNNRIRKVGIDGRISTVVGTGVAGYSGDEGPAFAAELASPEGVAIDSFGFLYIADTGNNHVREVSPGGVITTLI
jgi:sugar lactone lactonase YvrE